jgi:hypothetical protein
LKKNKSYNELIYIRLKLLRYMVELFFINIIYKLINVCILISENINKPMKKIYTYIYPKYSILFSFGKIILKLPVIIYIVFSLLKLNNCNINMIQIILNIIVFIVYVKYVKDVLKTERRFNHQGENNIKYVYLIFGGFYIICVSLSFSKDYIATNYLNYISFQTIKFLDIEIDGYSALRILWGVLNSLKEAVVAAIIFDTAYQMYNFNLANSLNDYLGMMISRRRLYILPEDSASENPRIWYILGDRCADIIENLEKYHIKRNDNFIIEYSDEQAENIIENRRRLFDDDSDVSFYSENSEYYFYFTLLDFSDATTTNFSMREIIEIIKNSLIELPKGLVVKEKKTQLEKLVPFFIKLQKKLKLDIHVCRIIDEY